ncbi:hypothetical protein P148_SR1C00001G1023 [candidate division SR1 bacterium RAAC1_SR1_1]|nr:hypothetical protein P148_SR1C00001G1023 [candidate division SR1 bacterium RAAC1_SR1_1]
MNEYWYTLFLTISLLGLIGVYILPKKYIFLQESWGLSQIFLWLSLRMGDFYLNIGAFPIKAFIYPNCGACGSDFPNEGSLSLFIINWFFRILITTFIFYFLPRSSKKKRGIWLNSIAIVCMFLGFLYLLIRFD